MKDLLFQKDIVKGKETARMVPCNADGRKAIGDLIDWHWAQYGTLDEKRPLFVSRQGGGALTRGQAHFVSLAARGDRNRYSDRFPPATRLRCFVTD